MLRTYRWNLAGTFLLLGLIGAGGSALCSDAEVDPSALWRKTLDAARLARSANDWDAANVAFEAAVQQAEQFGARDGRLTRTLEEAARAFTRQKHKTRALELQSRAVALRLERSDAPSVTTAESIYRLGKIHHGFAEFTEAEPLFRQALAMRERLDDANAQSTARILRDLAAVIRELRADDPEVESLLLRNLELDPAPRQRELLGSYYGEREAHQSALDRHVETLDLEQSRPLPSLSRMVDAATRAADSHLALDRQDAAERALLRALDLREQQLGSHHPYLAFTLRKLAELYVEQERFVEAEMHLLRAAALNDAAWGGPNHRCGCDTSSLLDQVHAALGRQPTADIEPIDVRSDTASTDEADDPRIEEIARLDTAAAGHSKHGEMDAAKQASREALEIRRELYGEASVELSSGIAHLAGLLRAEGRYDDAAELYRQRLRLLETHAEADDLRIASTLHTLGTIDRLREEYTDATGYFRREIAARTMRGQNLRAVRSLETLGNMNLVRKMPELAEVDFLEAARLWERFAGRAAPERIRVRALMAKSQLAQGKFDAAEATLDAVLEEEQGKRYPDSGLLLQIFQPLESLYRQTDREELADSMRARIDEMRDLHLAQPTRRAARSSAGVTRTGGR
jgi:tetratricopeptide (TPR) repeat protein